MKKIARLTSLLLVAVFLLAACGKKNESKTFKLERNGVSVQIEVEYDGDRVVRQKTHTVAKYADSGFINKEDAKNKIDPISKDYNEVKGIKHKMNYKDDYFVEDIDSDFENLDLEKAKNLPGFFIDDSTDGKISFIQTEKALKQMGFTEVK